MNGEDLELKLRQTVQELCSAEVQVDSLLKKLDNYQKFGVITLKTLEVIHMVNEYAPNTYGVEQLKDMLESLAQDLEIKYVM